MDWFAHADNRQVMVGYDNLIFGEALPTVGGKDGINESSL